MGNVLVDKMSQLYQTLRLLYESEMTKPKFTGILGVNHPDKRIFQHIVGLQVMSRRTCQ